MRYVFAARDSWILLFSCLYEEYVLFYLSFSLSPSFQDAAREGVTSTPSVDEKIDLHFVAFVQHDGKLYELDGRRAGPICHSSCSKSTFLTDVARVIQCENIEKSNALNFSLMALAGSSNE